MPLIVLFLVALLAALAAHAVARRYPESPATLPTVDTARSLGEAAGHRARARRFLTGRFDPAAATGLALTLALVVVVAGGVLLAVLAYLVRSNATLLHVDNGVARWGYDEQTPWSTRGLRLVTTLGETWFAVLAGIVLATSETVRTRSRWIVPFLVVVVLGNQLLTTTVKELAHRVRPDLNPIAATLGPSFPSGHSSTAAAFFAAAALLLGRRRSPALRAWLAAGAVGIAVAVASSRVLLDVHWLSDVIAGLLLGWAWFALCAIAFGGRLLRFGAAAEKVAEGAEAAEPERRLKSPVADG